MVIYVYGRSTGRGVPDRGLAGCAQGLWLAGQPPVLQGLETLPLGGGDASAGGWPVRGVEASEKVYSSTST